MAAKTTVRHFAKPIETCFCTSLQDTLLTYLGASTLPRGNLLSLSLAVFLSSVETTSGTAAVTDHFRILQDPDFDTDLIIFMSGA